VDEQSRHLVFPNNTLLLAKPNRMFGLGSFRAMDGLQELVRYKSHLLFGSENARLAFPLLTFLWPLKGKSPIGRKH